MRYEDVRDMMEEAKPMILEKARTMGGAGDENRTPDVT
jgi:hypothetical protein